MHVDIEHYDFTMWGAGVVRVSGRKVGWCINVGYLLIALRWWSK